MSWRRARRSASSGGPTVTTGWKSWLFTVDHKKIGIMYGVSAMVFFVVGGIEALLIRLQLARPNGTILSAGTYNEMFTMHGTTMVFLFVMPMAAAFANYLVPLQIGARDVAFPRLNALGFWAFLVGRPVPLPQPVPRRRARRRLVRLLPRTRGPLFSPTHGMDFWALALLITGIASLSSSINLIVTILNMRAPGMSLMKMPVFTWMILVVQFLLLFAVPGHHRGAGAAARSERLFGATFFNVSVGSRPAPVAAPVLDLRPPGGVHPHPAGLRHRVRGAADLLPQAPVRLRVRGLLRRRHRLHGLGRVGPPHVRLRPRADLGDGLLAHDDVHRRAHRREDHQLDWPRCGAAACASPRR